MTKLLITYATAFQFMLSFLSATAFANQNIPVMTEEETKQLSDTTNKTLETDTAILSALNTIEGEKTEQIISLSPDLLKNFLKLGGDQKAYDQITCFYDKYRLSRFINIKGQNEISSQDLRIKNKRFIVITDLNKPSSQARLFVLDLLTKEVKAYFTSHGAGVRGSQVTVFELEKLTEAKKKSLEYPVLISSKPGSNASPRGVFILGKTYQGSFGYSLKMHGIQKDINDTTYGRAVVMHGLKGMNSVSISSQDDEAEITKQLSSPGNLALSQGCTMLEPSRAKEIIDQVKDGSIYYVYTAAEKKEAANYCADKSLLEIK